MGYILSNLVVAAQSAQCSFPGCADVTDVCYYNCFDLPQPNGQVKLGAGAVRSPQDGFFSSCCCLAHWHRMAYCDFSRPLLGGLILWRESSCLHSMRQGKVGAFDDVMAFL